jgi:hypothetical protein
MRRANVLTAVALLAFAGGVFAFSVLRIKSSVCTNHCTVNANARIVCMQDELSKVEAEAKVHVDGAGGFRIEKNRYAASVRQG